jgi:predicted Zn-dependent protease
MLYASKHWEDLRVLAAHIRSIHQLAPLLGGYTDFLDGISEYGLQNHERADQLFKNILKNPPADAGLAFEAADLLTDLGQTGIAQTLLLPHETTLGNKPYYWVKLAVCAHANRQADLLLAAAKRGYALAPRDLALANNYALALLIDRSQPAEAIRLTVELIAAFPKSPSIRIHHSLALIRNNRISDARKILNSIRLDSLGMEERTYWYLAQFEAAFGSRDFGRARKCLKSIDTRFLFKPQIDWLSEMGQNLPNSEDSN